MLGTNKTAILIFANSSLKDELRKGIPNSTALFSALTENILIKVENTGLPYFIYDEQVQIGSDFGSRFTTAVEAVFNRGFESIITIGNDTPELTSNTILSTFKNLSEGKTVIGPSQDGGVYILGFHQANFNAASFRQLPWQTRHLFEKITVTTDDVVVGFYRKPPCRVSSGVLLSSCVSSGVDFHLTLFVEWLKKTKVFN